MAKRIKFENKQRPFSMRCAFCHKPAKELYYVAFEEGGDKYLLHPGNCFYKAQANFQEKKQKGIIPVESIETGGEFSEVETTSIEGAENIINQN
ncbi:MAG: hypothetical protein PHE73_08740 [Sulfurovaceae bacterium]|nr:hypothetical protein [Sulfurovaceae bacterium]